MAFQMIPPRLSSSPPPLDSLPPVTCPGVDEDDEFDHFASHNASFDITGLSDKLPPTPETSPSRLPGIRLGSTSERGLTEGFEATLEDSISQDSGVDSSNHPHEFSPQPQGDGHPCAQEDLSGGDGRRPDRESDGEHNDVDDFGDFQGICTAGTEALDEGEGECVGTVPGNTSQDWDKSQISSQPLSQKSENPKCKESDSSRHRTDFSPPPLDCVTRDTITELSSDFLPADDDDFGEFASYEAAFKLAGSANIKENCSSDSNLHSHDCQPASGIIMENDHEELDSGTSFHQIDSTTERLQADGDSGDEASPCKPKSVTGTDDEQQGEKTSAVLPSKEFLRPEESEVETTVISDMIRTPALSGGDVRGAADGMASSPGNTRESTKGSSVVAAATSDSDDSVNEEQRTGDESGLGKGSASLSGNGSLVPDHDRPVKGSDRAATGRDREVEPSSDAVECCDDVCENKSESEFGDFNQAEGGDDDDDDDDDDLDFADLRKQVEEGTFGDFGDFSSGLGEGNEGGGAECFGGDEPEGDDFGDFTAPADSEAKAEGDAFGDFVVQGKGAEDDFPPDFDDDDDDFGDFSAPENREALQGFTTAAVEAAPPQCQAQDDGVSKTSPIVLKLESLVAKWIPKAAGAPQEESCPVPLLHQTIESDAFVWRQLENLESSAALRLSWGNTQAHNLFLASVNVDARNILFGQKWSSSVPLFAQTLSFSPLTPAKSTEAAGGGAGSVGVGLVGAPKELPPDTFSTATAKHGRQTNSSLSDCSSFSTSGGSEEQIPPAKFDWTSSGLTNPLEGPAYSSSLFGLDLLLTNTKIGKGATNALLASLEQEFLSEGGDKGSGGRAAKSPPTPSPLVQQILGRGMSKVPSPATPLQSLAPEVRQVVTKLPDLSFMRSRVLMFPIRGDP